MAVKEQTSDDLSMLLSALCDGTIEAEDFARLERRLEADPAARRWYIAYLDLHGELCWDNHEHEGRKPGEPPPISGPAQPAVEPIFPPIIIDASSANQSLSARWLEAIGPWVLPYIAATVFVCAMLLGFWAYKLPSDRGSSIASSDNSRRSTTSGEASSHDRPAPVFVGRVTGIAGAKWSDEPNYIAPIGVRVALGRTYNLKSGLIEITYDTGAKVILEGPCSYEVDSTAGGYLALGKLVARVRAGGEGRGTGEAASGQWPVVSVKDENGQRNPASLATSHSPLATDPSPLSPLPSPHFFVRTPTAIITDLGTEFGMEVNSQGRTTAYVFDGTVVVSIHEPGAENPPSTIQYPKSLVLTAGQSARVEKSAAGQASFTHPTTPPQFFRRIEPPPSNLIRIVEKFAEGKLSKHFEQMPPGRYAILPGAAEYNQQAAPSDRESRAFIRSTVADFIDRDFVFEATVRVDYEGPILPANANTGHRIFFGLGNGVPNEHYYDLVRCGVVMDYTVDTGRAFVRYCHPDSDLRISSRELGRELAEVAEPGSLRPGRHRLRMEKTGPWLAFSLDADYDGTFRPDYVGRKIHILAAGPQLLDRANARLLIGAGNCDKMRVCFEELSVEYHQINEARKDPK